MIKLWIGLGVLALLGALIRELYTINKEENKKIALLQKQEQLEGFDLKNKEVDLDEKIIKEQTKLDKRINKLNP